jgi:anti-sigma factor ChrR (cupin superfamily)
MSDELHLHGAADLAAGALDPEAEQAFHAHTALCAECRRAAADLQEVVATTLAAAGGAPAPAPSAREHVLALARAPRGPIDLTAYTWTEIARGIRAHEIYNEGGVRGVLIWADSGARHPTHRHVGEEDLLILQGALADERGVYGPGEVCRSRRGEIHSETIVSDGECVCFAVYYHGGIEPA